MNSPENINTKTIDQALEEIAEIRQEIATMGFNDTEFSTLEQIVKRLNIGEIGPEEATHEARGILSSKQDYH